MNKAHIEFTKSGISIEVDSSGIETTLAKGSYFIPVSKAIAMTQVSIKAGNNGLIKYHDLEIISPLVSLTRGDASTGERFLNSMLTEEDPNQLSQEVVKFIH